MERNRSNKRSYNVRNPQNAGRRERTQPYRATQYRQPQHSAPVRHSRRVRDTNKLMLLISAIIGTIYFIYLVANFSGAASNAASDSEALGVSIATALVMPHMIFEAIATVLNWVATFTKSVVVTLISAIMYCVAGILFIGYAMFLVPEIVLTFVVFARFRKNRMR